MGSRQARRPGDWTCPRCRYSNFAFRAACNSCGAAASGGRAGKGEARSGEAVNAQRGAHDGRFQPSAMDARTAAVRAGEPSYHVHRGAGISAPARLGAGPRTASQLQHGPGAGGGSAAALSQRDAPREGAAAACAVANTAVETTRGAWDAAVESGNGATSRPRWADDEPPCDNALFCGDEGSDYADDDAAWEDDDIEDGADEDENSWHSPPAPEELRSRWQQECRAVRALERAEKAEQAPSSALLAARATRDRAEDAWREALKDRPVAIRMVNAQRKADRAQRAVERAAQELDSFEEEMRQRRKELQDALEYAKERYDGRLRQLDALHKEAGELAAANAGCAQRSGPAEGKAERLVNILTSEMQALIELIDEGSEARGKANLILARVASADVDAPPTTGHQHFSIHTDAEDADPSGGFHTVTRKGRKAGAKGVGTEVRREPTWTAAANGRWNRYRALDDADDGMCVDDRAEDEGPEGARRDEPRERIVGAAPKGGAGKGAAAQGQAEASNGREVRPGKGWQAPNDDDGEVQQRPNKSHRGHDVVTTPTVEGDGDDAARALQLKREQDAIIQATLAARANFGDEATMHIAGQIYAQKVAALEARAKAAGIVPAAGGRELIQLTPEELNTWVESALKPAEGKEEEEAKEL